MRLASVGSSSRRAVRMGLCGPDTPGAHLLYTFGRGDRYWGRWFSSRTTDGDRAKRVAEIRAEAAKNQGTGNAAFLKAALEAAAASIIARAALAASLHEAMYSRLNTISGHASTYAQDMGPWFERGAPCSRSSRPRCCTASKSTEETGYFNQGCMEHLQFDV